MKYIVIDELKNDMFTNEYETKEEAVKAADWEWGRLAESDKKRRVAFYVLESVNPDEDTIDHFDGDVIKSYK